MQIALNQLLQRARPDRLLIEPTGLGHPIEILQTLADDHYRPILKLQKILTLVDARQLADSRYTSHDIFKQQISIADLIVGNKQDLYGRGDREALETYASEHNALGALLHFTDHGRIEIDWLAGETAAIVSHHSHHQGGADATPSENQSLPEAGFIRAENVGAGYRSIGWRFSPSTLFDHRKLVSYLSCIVAQRMKAVFITDRGIFGYNLTPDALTEMAIDDAIESRMEIISDDIDDSWEEALLGCVIAKA
jgi:G3E family GTPase